MGIKDDPTNIEYTSEDRIRVEPTALKVIIMGVSNWHKG